MTEGKNNKAGWKQKIIYEVTEYWINFVYLAFFSGSSSPIGG
jgi:hypothetical protein